MGAKGRESDRCLVVFGAVERASPLAVSDCRRGSPDWSPLQLMIYPVPPAMLPLYLRLYSVRAFFLGSSK